MTHLDTIGSIYDAFGRGDINAILSRLSETIEWEYGANSTDVPWLQPRKGRSGAAEFFQALSALEIKRFDVSRVADGGERLVVALVNLEAVVRDTGKPIVETDEVHIWHFDEAGLVTRFRHRADTHQHWRAYHGHEE